jgi:ribonuclease-3
LFRKLIQFLRLPFLSKRNNFYQLKMITGLFPGNIHLYEIALTHKSASVSLPDGSTINNERLEYLGDAVLGAIIADYLYLYFPDKNEGFLTQLRSKIVKRKQLNKLAFKIGLSQLIILNTRQNQHKENILGNAFEALIGAMYLDHGYYKTRKFVINKILKRHINLEKLARKESDFKSRLIEWSQKNKKEISFITEECTDKTDEQMFASIVIVTGEELGRGKGYSKKDAEQKASEKALGKIADQID